MATGGFDESIRLWDFQGMDERLQSFRMVTPYKGYPVKWLSFSASGGMLLAICGAKQVSVFNWDGIKQRETKLGDVYLNDTAKTMGHISEITSGQFNPQHESKFMTCSRDASVRIWDTEGKLVGLRQQLAHEQLVKSQHFKTYRPSFLWTASYSPDGNVVAASANDGTIKAWDFWRPIFKPHFLIKDAHEVDIEVTSIDFFEDGQRLLSWCQGGTLKMWDLRFSNAPIEIWTGL